MRSFSTRIQAKMPTQPNSPTQPKLPGLDPDEKKHCTKCGKLKPLSAFGNNRNTPDRLQYWCRLVRPPTREFMSAQRVAGRKCFMHGRSGLRSRVIWPRYETRQRDGSAQRKGARRTVRVSKGIPRATAGRKSSAWRTNACDKPDTTNSARARFHSFGALEREEDSASTLRLSNWRSGGS